MTWDYIAGFFDGEGSIGHNGKGFRLSIPQTNKKVLAEIKDFAGAGYIFQVTKRKAHWKDSWTYYLARQSEVYIFLQRILPYLIVKRLAVERALRRLEFILAGQERRRVLRIERERKARELRKQGLPYRRIGQRLGIDWGYARRLILQNNGGRSSVG